MKNVLICTSPNNLNLVNLIVNYTDSFIIDRKLIDYFDKNLAILPVENWCYYERMRHRHRQGGWNHAAVNAISEQIFRTIEEKGPISSRDLDYKEIVDWSWNATSLSRAALESLYFRGDLVIHHKARSIKFYAFARDFIPAAILEAPDPFPDRIDHLKWRLQNRISAVGLLWNKPSDAWLGVESIKSPERNQVFAELLAEQKLVEIQVEGIKFPLYCLARDLPLLDQVIRPDFQACPRLELVAPLDSLLWDRRLVEALFGFYYKWEIYTPIAERKYAYYVLPILYGDRFIGRTEVVNDKKNDALLLKALWFEPGIEVTAVLSRRLHDCLIRFMAFQGLSHLINSTEYQIN